MIRVEPLTEDRFEAYASFIPLNAVTAFYATLEFRRFLLDSAGGSPTYFVALDNERVTGVLPLFARSHASLGTVINSLPWYGSHGGCLLSDPRASDVRASLLRAALPTWTSPEVAFSNMILSHAETGHLSEYRDILQPEVVDDRVGQVTELPIDGPDLEERLEQGCLQKTRNLVRKSLRQGFELEAADHDEGWAYLVDTHHENLAALGGKAKPREHFEAMRRAFPESWRRLMIARLAGRPVAALLLIRFGSTVEYLTPVISHDFRSQQPLSFLIWHGMLQAVRDGFRHWNWGGTWRTQVSLFHFKAGWGARALPYQYLCSARPDARTALAADPAAVMAAYPYYFLYPLPANG